jgi:peptide/nickel transport system substrate-binding protein
MGLEPLRSGSVQRTLPTRGTARLLTVLLGVTLLLGACSGGSGTNSPSSRSKAVLTDPSPYDTLDVHASTTIAARQIGDGLYDRLAAVGPGGSIIPYLAKSWVVTPGSITFTVRTDAICSDATRVTPDVIANSLRRSLAKASTVPQVLGKGPFTVTADDADHVTVKVANSASTNLAPVFADVQLSIYCPAGLSPSADFATQSYGSGPYTLVSASTGNLVVMKLRPEWKWGPKGTTAATLPKELDIKFISDDTTAANLLLTGGLDISIISNPADIPRLANDKSLNHVSGTSLYSTWLWFNQTPSKPGADPAVRKALMTAIDRNTFNKGSNQAYGSVASSIIGPDVPCYDNVSGLLPKPSLDEAKSILQADGYVLGSDSKFSKGGKPLAVRLVGHLSDGAGIEYLVAVWTSLGVTVTVAQTDNTTFITNYTTGNFDAAVHRVINEYDVPLRTIGAFVGASPGSSSANQGRVIDPVAAQQADDAKSALNEQDRCAAIKKLQRTLVQNYDYLPLAYQQVHWFARGWTLQPAVAQGLKLYTLRPKP